MALRSLDIRLDWLIARSGITQPRVDRRLNAIENQLVNAASQWRESHPIEPARELQLSEVTLAQLVASVHWSSARHALRCCSICPQCLGTASPSVKRTVPRSPAVAPLQCVTPSHVRSRRCPSTYDSRSRGIKRRDGAACAAATRLGLQVFFCDRHSPWQRGTNENTYGLLRQYFPKGTDLRGVTVTDLNAVAFTLKTRPRKKLGWRTPAEILNQLLQETSINPVAMTD